MTPTAMEDAINKLDHRLGAVEQILPTLATKTDLEPFATKVDLERFATKVDLERFATKVDLERFATKADLERFATKADLEGFATKTDLAPFATRVEVEDVRHDIRKVAEAVAGLSTIAAANQQTLEKVVERLEVREAMLVTLTRKRR